MKAEETITVVNVDDFKKLPVATQKIITDLTKDLKVTGLNVLNPLVENMAIIEGFKAIKYVEDSEECITQYKDAKAFIRSFRAETGRAKTALKKPFLETGKKLDLIEKTFVNGATAVHDMLDLEFKSYLEAELEKANEKLAKKNSESIAYVSGLEESNKKQQDIIVRINLFNKAKSDIQKYLDDALANAETYSELALVMEIGKYMAIDVDYNSDEFEVLTEEQKTELKSLETKTVDAAKRILTLAKEEVIRNNSVNRDAFGNKLLTPEEAFEPVAEEDKIPERPPLPGNGFIPAIKDALTLGDYMTMHFEELVNSLEAFQSENEVEIKTKEVAIKGIQSYLVKLLNYLNENRN